LFEELATDAEHADKTTHPKIFIGRIGSPAWTEVSRAVDELVALVDQSDPRLIRAALRAMVPEYTGGLAELAGPAVNLPIAVSMPPELSELHALSTRPEAPESVELAARRRNDGTGSQPALAVRG
jgi:hypothetical protein